MFRIHRKGLGYVTRIENTQVTFDKDSALTFTSRQQAENLAFSLSEKYNIQLEVLECEE